jgi:membrane dipeptidase
MTIDRREFLSGGAAVAFAWALPALGKAANVAPLMKDAEDIYMRAIVIDMLAD